MEEQAAIQIEVPAHHVGSLKELIRQHHGLTFVSQGWIVRKFAIIGAQQDIAGFRPKLDAWVRECEAADAW